MASGHPFERRIAAAWPVSQWQDVTVLVAVSGGRDSVALLRALARVRDPSAGSLVVANFNHGWRGAESDGDEVFVQRLSDALQLPCEVGRAPTGLAAVHTGLEVTARQLRYQFLRATADRLGARYVATAHTADDQVETILHRIVRGTGLRGLAGIPRIRPLSPLTTLVRPMLHIHRPELQAYLDDLQQVFREDSSNAATHHTRNRIRHQLLPTLRRDYNPCVEQAVQRLGELAHQAQLTVDALADTLRTQCVSYPQANRVRIDCVPLRNQSPYLVRELLHAVWCQLHWPRQDMSERKWRELCRLVQHPDSTLRRFTLPGRIEVHASGDVVECARHAPDG